MAVLLSDVLPGAFFTYGDGVPTQKYLLTKYEGTLDTKLVAYNLVQSVLVEFDDSIMVTEITLAVGTAPVFTI